MELLGLELTQKHSIHVGCRGSPHSPSELPSAQKHAKKKLAVEKTEESIASPGAWIRLDENLYAPCC